MKAEGAFAPLREHIPASLFRHPAWIAWKQTQGWRHAGTLDACPILLRQLDAHSSMAYAVGPQLEDGSADDAYGGRLEELSRRAQALLPSDCAFIRWDLMNAAWKDARGQALDTRLQELRMNAATRHRRFRKAATEHMFPDTMLVDLRGGWPTVSARMEYRARYTAHLAQRRGTTVERVGEAGLDEFHGLLGRTALARGLRLHSKDAYQGLFRAAREHGLSLELYQAMAKGIPVAAALFARHKREAWYLFAASHPEHRPFAGPGAILYQALRDCAEAGDERVDLCGVAPAGMRDHPLSGLSLFKAGFGGLSRSRAGAWDFVLKSEAYEAYTRSECVALR